MNKKCADCGRRITMQSKTSIPPCPNFNENTHTKKCWKNLSGQGDDKRDPYPNSKNP